MMRRKNKNTLKYPTTIYMLRKGNICKLSEMHLVNDYTGDMHLAEGKHIICRKATLECLHITSCICVKDS